MNDKKKNRGFSCIVLIIGLILGVKLLVKSRDIPNKPPDPAVQQKTLNDELSMPAATALRDGIGIVVIVDTSGSMDEKVKDAEGQSKKIDIAKKVTRKTFEEIRTFSEKNPDKLVQVGLTQFNSIAGTIIPMGPIAQVDFESAVNQLDADGNTAIGDALVSGKQQLNKAALKKQYMIVITDGENTTGRNPEAVVKAMQALPENQRPTVYLIAFDVDAKVFAPLVQYGVSVAQAQNEKNLQGALDYILYEKILVEQE